MKLQVSEERSATAQRQLSTSLANAEFTNGQLRDELTSTHSEVRGSSLSTDNTLYHSPFAFVRGIKRGSPRRSAFPRS